MWVSESEDDTERVGEELARELGDDAVVVLEGDLGSGKTVLVRGMARALGVDPRQVQSPTYALIHEYDGTRARLVHVDLYRLEGEDVDSLGLEEILNGPGIKAIEWGERLDAALLDAAPASNRFPAVWRIRIESRDDGTRQIRCMKDT